MKGEFVKLANGTIIYIEQVEDKCVPELSKVDEALIESLKSKTKFDALLNDERKEEKLNAKLETIKKIRESLNKPSNPSSSPY